MEGPQHQSELQPETESAAAVADTSAAPPLADSAIGVGAEPLPAAFAVAVGEQPPLAAAAAADIRAEGAALPLPQQGRPLCFSELPCKLLGSSLA